MIHLAYDNGDLIKLLKKRGKLISEGDYLGMKKLNKNLIRHLESNYNKYRLPVKAFVTFKN